jgi:two-component system, OmpR family, osmolarity sensor histidine kinase EnvZ
MTQPNLMQTFGRWLFKKRRLRDVTPKGLFGRSLLIIALPVAVMQIAVLWMFFDSQWETVTTRLSEGVAGDIAVIVQEFEARPDEANLAKLSALAMGKMSLSVVLQPGASLPVNIRSSIFSVLDRTLREALRARLEAPFWFDTTRYPAYVDIQVQTRAGVLRFIAPRDKVFSTNGHIFVFWLIAATFIQTGIAVIFIRNQVRPIQRLANAAERIGKGQNVDGFSPSGAREVRRAATAFLEMKERIARFVDQRTTMLAGVSHDLRTPLTRLKLQLAMMEDEGAALDDARQDVREMERMLDGYLAFVRDKTEEKNSLVNLETLIATCAENARRSGANVAVRQTVKLEMMGKKNALARCVANLVDNAMGYGKTVHLSLTESQNGIEIIVEDDGPGMDTALYEAAFAPFNRLDAARNANRQGVGLGLPIARDIARAHGGDIVLGRAALGGLRAVLQLPFPQVAQD